MIWAVSVFGATAEKPIRVPKPAPAQCNLHGSVLDGTKVSSPPPRTDDRGFDVISYDLDFRLDPAHRSIAGEVSISLVFLRSIDEPLELDLVSELDCTNVVSGSQTLAFWQQEESLFITLPTAPVTDETMTISVAWEGQPPRHGNYYAGLLFRTHDENTPDPGDDVPIIASISEPWSAHSWWPCKDHPADKAIYKASITVPDTLIAISNGTLTETTVDESGWRTFHWAEEFPMPTYLFSVAVSNYLFWEESCPVDDAWPGHENIPLEFYFFPEDEPAARSDMEPTCQMMQMLTSIAGPYPFKGEKYAQVEIKWAGAMEHTTATSISQYLITGDREYETIIVHEMAHHWFGNSLTPAAWADIWLNEGFARYSEALWVEFAYGRQAYVDFMATIGRNAHPDLFHGAGILADPDPILPNILVYDKGAWVLHMLRVLIGDQAFFTFLRDYAQNPDLAMNSITTQDMIGAAEIASGRDLQDFFTPWLTTDLVPSLQVRTFLNQAEHGAGPDPYVRIEINQVQDPVFIMALPIRLHTACGDIDEIITIEDRSTVWRSSTTCKIDSVSIDPESLALFQMGPAPDVVLRIEGPIPNPVTKEGTDFFFTIKEAGSLVVNLYDVRGRRLASFNGGQYLANTDSNDPAHLWHWDGTAAGKKLTAAGVYWLEFLVSGTRQVHKVVFLP